MTRKLVFALIFLFVSVASYAQKNFLKEADFAFTNREFFTAIELYKKAYAKEKKPAVKAEILFKTAECYRQINDWKQAETWYTKAIKANYPKPEAILYLAMSKKVQGKYDEAKVEFDNYKAKKPDDKRGEDGSKSCQLAAKWKNKPDRYVVENMALINSKDQDFSPTYPNNKYNSLYFTSTRPGATGGKTDGGLGQLFSDLFETKMDKNGKWSTPVPIAPPLNTEDNEGASIVIDNGKTIFFTRCKEEKKQSLNCMLYMAQKKGNNFGDGQLLNFCADTLNMGHPAISADEQIMVFASDMPGGNGGKDLYISKYDKKSKSWGKPENLGTGINTGGNEMYPFIHEDGTLYFSSDEHLGMGGLDIFKAEKKAEGSWGTPVNLKYPMNSSGDDFGIIFEGKKERGYLSSNREGTKGSDDIWSFVLPPCMYTLDGVVTDCKNKIPLGGITVVLIGSDGSNVEAKSDDKGYYKFSITENVTYEVKVDANKLKGITSQFAPGYIYDRTQSSAKLSTVGEKECNKIFTRNLCLVPEEKEIRFPEVLYDLGKADLRPESKDSLNFLYNTLIDNPGLVIELSAHTDSRATNPFNMKLSTARAKSCVDYLISKGINPKRMVAKGYGEERLKYTDADIAKQPTKEEQEALHQKNRRTVFSVLSKDFVDPNAPKPQPIAPPQPKPEEKPVDETEEGE